LFNFEEFTNHFYLFIFINYKDIEKHKKIKLLGFCDTCTYKIRILRTYIHCRKKEIKIAEKCQKSFHEFKRLPNLVFILENWDYENMSFN